jgi:hypothetical protein
MKRTLAVLAATAIAVAAGCGGGDTSPGSSLDWNGFSGGGLVKPHRTFSWGGTALYNRDSEPVTLRDVKLVEPTNGLRLLAVYAVPDPNDWVGFRRGIASFVKREPLDGSIIPPKDAGRPKVGLMLVYQAEPGRSRYSGLSITYEREGDTYTQTIPSKLSVATKANPRA